MGSAAASHAPVIHSVRCETVSLRFQMCYLHAEIDKTTASKCSRFDWRFVCELFVCKLVQFAADGTRRYAHERGVEFAEAYERTARKLVSAGLCCPLLTRGGCRMRWLNGLLRTIQTSTKSGAFTLVRQVLIIILQHLSGQRHAFQFAAQGNDAARHQVINCSRFLCIGFCSVPPWAC